VAAVGAVAAVAVVAAGVDVGAVSVVAAGVAMDTAWASFLSHLWCAAATGAGDTAGRSARIDITAGARAFRR